MDLKIPKIEFPVEVALDDAVNKTEDLAFFLSQVSRYSNQPETLEELLNSGQAFVPVKRMLTGKTMIINLDRVAYIKEKKGASERSTKTVVTIHLDSHFTLQVQLYEALAPFQERTIDFFNSKNMFLPFLTENVKILVNKKKIIRITER